MIDVRITGLGDVAEAVVKRGYRFFPAVDETLTAGVKAGALYTKMSILAITPKKLRGVSYKKGGAKIGVSYKIYKTGMVPYAIIQATGPFHLWERDTKKHPVPTRGRKKGARRMLVGQLGSNDWFSATKENPVWVGGSKGKHTFALGAEAARPKLKTVMQQAQRRALIKTMQ